jgi:hypothetical protein
MPLARMIAQAKPAHAKAPVKSPRPAAKRASIVFAHFELIRHFRLYSKTLFRQWNLPLV